MELGKQTLKRLRELLCENIGDQWSIVLAAGCGCSVGEVERIFNRHEKDDKKVILLALELLAGNSP